MVFVFLNVMIIDTISPAKHEDWEGVTTTRIGESTSSDIVEHKQYPECVHTKYEESACTAVRAAWKGVCPEEQRITEADRSTG